MKQQTGLFYWLGINPGMYFCVSFYKSRGENIEIITKFFRVSKIYTVIIFVAFSI